MRAVGEGVYGPAEHLVDSQRGVGLPGPAPARISIARSVSNTTAAVVCKVRRETRGAWSPFLRVGFAAFSGLSDVTGNPGVLGFS